MPKMNRVERALKRIDAKWERQEQQAKEAEVKVPHYGEIMFERKRDSRRAFAETWANMTPEKRDAELQIPGRGDEIMGLMGENQ